MSRPTELQKATVLDFAGDQLEAWSINSGVGDEEYFNSATRTFNWDAAQGVSALSTDIRLGMAALSAAYCYYKRPYVLADRLKWRYWAIEAVDTWFRDHQNPANGAMRRDGADNNIGTLFGIPQVLTVAKCLGLRTRWATQVGRAVDWLTATGEKTWYINGNFQIGKTLAYWTASWMNGFPAGRVQDYEDVWNFTLAPSAFLGNGTWLGYGYFEDATPNSYGTRGWFTETTSSTPGTSQIGNPTYDHEYAMLQAEFLSMGYMYTGDARYREYMMTVTNKILDTYNPVNGRVDCTGGSRHLGSGSYFRYFSPATLGIATWILNREQYAPLVDNAFAVYTADVRGYFNATAHNFYRGCGYQAAPMLLALQRPLF